MKLLWLFLCCGFVSQAAVIPVGKEFQVKTISSALEKANPGDTILIHAGTYREGNIKVNRRVVLLGVDYPVLDGEKKGEILSIYADSVVVRGLKLIRSGRASLNDPCAVKVYNRQYVEISDNILDDNFFGIYLSKSKNCIVKNNRIRAYGKAEHAIGNGIHCWQSSDLQIIGNNIDGHRDGIYFEFVYHSVIWRNIATNNVRYGLHFMFSHNDSYISNVFRNNGAGVSVMFTKNVTMMNNTFEQNWGDSAYGLMLKEISDSYISGNRFLNNTTGIFMEGTNRTHVEKNKFEGNGWAMRVQASCLDNVIETNNFTGNTFDMATNGTLVQNTFNGNYWDKYDGYDLDRDGFGDVPYHPLSLFAVLVENTPSAMLLFRSFMITLLDKSEKILPSITPDNFVDQKPLMRALPL